MHACAHESFTGVGTGVGVGVGFGFTSTVTSGLEASIFAESVTGVTEVLGHPTNPTVRPTAKNSDLITQPPSGLQRP